MTGGRLDDGAAQLARLRPPGWQTGSSPATEDREMAIAFARRAAAAADEIGNLARQYLRVLGIS